MKLNTDIHSDERNYGGGQVKEGELGIFYQCVRWHMSFTGEGCMPQNAM